MHRGPAGHIKTKKTTSGLHLDTKVVVVVVGAALKLLKIATSSLHLDAREVVVVKHHLQLVF